MSYEGFWRFVAVGELVAGQPLVSDDPGAFEKRERKTWKPAHGDLVGSYAGGGADRNVVGKFDVRRLLPQSS